MDLTLYLFNLLDMDGRASYLWENGEYVGGIYTFVPLPAFCRTLPLKTSKTLAWLKLYYTVD